MYYNLYSLSRSAIDAFYEKYFFFGKKKKKHGNIGFGMRKYDCIFVMRLTLNAGRSDADHTLGYLI